MNTFLFVSTIVLWSVVLLVGFLLLPYTTVFLIAWSVLLLGWMALGLPVGPAAGLRLAPAP